MRADVAMASNAITQEHGEHFLVATSLQQKRH